MTTRTGTCQDCGAETIGGERGALPKRCPACYKAYRARYHQAREAVRPLRERKVHDVVCSDCGTQFQWSASGAPPTRCKECVKARKLDANRERGRLRRAAKKAGSPHRIGVCTECMAEFIGPARGSIPSKCPPCTIEWNKTRWKLQVNRNETTRRLHLLKKYGITLDDWDKMLAEQGGRCAICGDREEETIGRLHVDHDHLNGKVRALLCQPCNTTLGKMKESPALLRAAADYLERFQVV